MPKAMEDSLRRQAHKKGLSGEQYDAYVYGTMRKTGWTPSREAKTNKHNARRIRAMRGA